MRCVAELQGDCGSSSKATMNQVRIKRVYDPRSSDDGQRVLVGGLWPRGLTKVELADALWLREIAPSSSLRTWFAHKPERWVEFRSRYFAELESNPAVKSLEDIIRSGPTTLLFSARDKIHNQAVALSEYMSRAPGSVG
jgi:uncharacterized protein YeaO (DUF488 family)